MSGNGGTVPAAGPRGDPPLLCAAGSDRRGVRCQLLTGLLKCRFNEHVSGHFQAELFVPGDYYGDARNDVAVLCRYEIVFSW